MVLSFESGFQISEIQINLNIIEIPRRESNTLGVFVTRWDLLDKESHLNDWRPQVCREVEM